jgi:hypothetical protein
MSKYLIRTVETYRTDSESEAKQLIESAKADSAYTLSKYSSESKTTKSKGEIVDSWYRVTLTKDFCSEKEPDVTATVEYKVENGAFPAPREKDEDDIEEMPF